MFRVRSWWLAPGLFALLSLAVFGTWFKFRGIERASAREQLELLAEQTARRIEDFVRSRLLLVETVRSAHRRGAWTDLASFVSFATVLQERLPGLQAINFVRPDGVIDWVAPVLPNLEAKGKNILANPVAGPVLRCAFREDRPCMTPPLDLFQGGKGFATYYPLHDASGELIGCVNGVFRIDELLNQILVGEEFLERFHLHIDDLDYVVHGGPIDQEESLRATADLSLLDRHWTLVLTSQSPAWIGLASYGDRDFLVAGFALALAISLTVFLAQQRAHFRAREQAARLSLQERLSEVQRMEVISQLSGGVAHDFNNLLTSISGNAALARDLAEQSEQGVALLDKVLLACDRAGELTGQLLSMSRRHQLASGSVWLDAALSQERALLEAMLADEQRLEYDLEAGEVRVPLHASQLLQILLNLVDNARAASPARGVIRVRTRLPEGKDDRVVLEVIDQGTGMSEEVQKRAFDPFFTTKGDSGSGLGLPTVARLVRNAGGEMALNSAPGQGTVVRIRLPMASNETPSSAAHTPTPGVSRALVVEDDPDVRELLVTLLQHDGWEVSEAADAESALTQLSTVAPPDLLITDFQLQGMSGVEWLSRVRELGVMSPAILSSGFSHDIDHGQLASLGAVFLAKPFHRTALLDAVQRCLEMRKQDQAVDSP